MKRSVSIFGLLFLFCVQFELGRAAQTARPSAKDVSDKYESQVTKLINSGAFLEAVKSVANYEQAVLGLYAPASFELGLLQSSAQHLSLQSSFDGWGQQPIKEAGLPEWLPATGVDFLLALQGKGEN